MAAADTTVTGGTRRWRISVGERADVVFHLRDYFRRHGVAAEVCAPTEVELDTEVVGAELGKHLADWSRVMDVPAKFVSKPARVDDREAVVSRPLPRLGSLLTSKGFITEAQLELALNESRETGEMLGAVLLRKRWIFEEELSRTLSEQLSLPYLSIGRIGVDPAVTRLMPREVGVSVGAIPVRYEGDLVQVAFADPTDPSSVEAVNAHLRNISMAVAELSDIRLAWREVR
jgi:MshEN domain